MTDIAKSRVRFSLRLVLIAFVLLAIGLTAGIKFYNWYFSVPLADAVNEFNRRHAMSVNITWEDELSDSIRRQLPTLESSDEVKNILARIAETRTLPPQAFLDVSTDEWGLNPEIVLVVRRLGRDPFILDVRPKR